MAGLELAQGQYVDLAGDAVVVVAAFDAQQIAFPAVFVRSRIRVSMQLGLELIRVFLRRTDFGAVSQRRDLLPIIRDFLPINGSFLQVTDSVFF